MIVKQILELPASKIENNESFYEFTRGTNKVILLVIDKKYHIQYEDCSESFLNKCIKWLEVKNII